MKPIVFFGFLLFFLSRTWSESVPQYQKFLQKAESGEPVTVVYLGGSITRGATAWPLSGTDAQGKPFDFTSYDREKDSWRTLTFEWLRHRYEQTPGQFRQVNAAIGGTPSLLGAYRLEQDVLSKNPDLVFVEFAVNDAYASFKTRDNPDGSDSILRTCSSIVTRLRNQNPDIAVFMPLSTHRVWADSEHAGWSEALDCGHDQTRLAAEYLHVPYVSIKRAFEKMRPEGADPFYGGTDTSGNYVHPAPEGHRAYAETVEAALTDIFESGLFSFEKKKDVMKPYPVSPQLVLPETLQKFSKGWKTEMLTDVESPILEGHACLVPVADDAMLEYTFDGTSVGLWFDSQSKGTCKVFLDGKVLGTYVSKVKEPGQFRGRFCSLAKDLELSEYTLRLLPSAGSRILLRALTIDRDET
ncbi:SGNH/GDSL hydrolase family protein [Tichowtungia aerotolerans]|uniref:SGNH hydrolase-type esterase domain-containing protein n=1 Tax=Tichowtungia aerotolerans TaxID=2697043 RepID=A0A6P1MI98_9BACT|nr:SGNH/GDSL hydrolase family protein [Tichowtungia aerotolerans]QHI70775.1 hypothetical protein GT409_15445 [Tichowtungia aerotolerans]